MDFGETVIAASTADLSEEPGVRGPADAVEFRMDLAEDPAEAVAAYDGELPLIATNRASWEGGDADEEDRLASLAAATESPAVEAIDIELSAIRGADGADTARTAREADVAVIASVHEFEGTPRPGVCRELLAEATARADVGKLAVTPTSRADVLDLLSVTDEFAGEDGYVATVAMGELGRHSRVVAPLYGSAIAYGAVEESAATAPGQFDVATLADLLDSLEPRAG